MADVLADWVETSPVMTDADAHVPGYGIYPTKDGRAITLGVVSEQALWAATCRGLRLEHHADVPFLQRFERLKELDGEIAGAIAALTRDEAVACPSRAEMHEHEHFRARGIGTGPARTTNRPNPTRGTAPELDEHRGEGRRRAD